MQVEFKINTFLNVGGKGTFDKKNKKDREIRINGRENRGNTAFADDGETKENNDNMEKRNLDNFHLNSCHETYISYYYFEGERLRLETLAPWQLRNYRMDLRKKGTWRIERIQGKLGNKREYTKRKIEKIGKILKTMVIENRGM